MEEVEQKKIKRNWLKLKQLRKEKKGASYDELKYDVCIKNRYTLYTTDILNSINKFMKKKKKFDVFKYYTTI